MKKGTKELNLKEFQDFVDMIGHWEKDLAKGIITKER